MNAVIVILICILIMLGFRWILAKTSDYFSSKPFFTITSIISLLCISIYITSITLNKSVIGIFFMLISMLLSIALFISVLIAFTEIIFAYIIPGILALAGTSSFLLIVSTGDNYIIAFIFLLIFGGLGYTWIFLSIYGSIKKKQFLKRGIVINASIIDILELKNQMYSIVVEFAHPLTNEVIIVQSESIDFHALQKLNELIHRRTIHLNVFVDPSNINNYWVDIRPLKK